MNIKCVILAGGQGKRMKSSTPKVLHPLFGKPILMHIVDTVKTLRPRDIVIVVSEVISHVLEDIEGIDIVIQRRPLGTGDALKKALEKVKFDKTLLVMNGDTPLIREETLRRLILLHKKEKNDITFLSFITDEPGSYGRIIRNDDGKVMKIVEAMALKEKDKDIKEVNAGVYLIEPTAVELLRSIRKNSISSEYYLTDIIEIARKRGLKVNAHPFADEEEMIGINTRIELSRAIKIMQKRISTRHMENGVTIIDPESVFISPDSEIGMDTVIYPCVYIEGKTRIGRNCMIFPGVRIINSSISDRVIIKDSVVIEESIIEDSVVIGPFTHLRPESHISKNARLGNFVEVKKSFIGEGTKALHLSYIGDAEIGKNVNIGAGTITCNYDGIKKHKTIIEDDVFIGSDTQLVAPIKVSKGAYIGAGSTITKDVPPLSLAISRVSQRHIPDWVKKRKR